MNPYNSNTSGPKASTVFWIKRSVDRRHESPYLVRHLRRLVEHLGDDWIIQSPSTGEIGIDEIRVCRYETASGVYHCTVVIWLEQGLDGSEVRHAWHVCRSVSDLLCECASGLCPGALEPDVVHVVPDADNLDEKSEQRSQGQGRENGET